ncbi:sodium:proton antiporter [Neokomagataea tanensis]|uniref:Sodium:proton antiporter n=1 Tax=Neokomagataea tanensis TaxID=661191 RepID=A0A4Y6VBF1_9PROT|nr:sodium:proton antiporter [Neokomagataea tanensis]
MPYDIFIGIALTFGAGILAQWAAWKLRLPAIVLLFTIGLIIGPGLGLLHPSESMGWVFRPLVSLLVAIVVFEGGMALDIRQLRDAGDGVSRLTMVALPINWILGSLAARYVAHLEWGTSLLFGAIIVVTGPTVILPLLRSAKLKPRLAAFLRWEAIVNDPLGAILAAVVLQLLILHVDVHTSVFFTDTLPDLLTATGLSVVAGIAPAYMIRTLFVRDLMPEILKTPALLSVALVLFSACNMEMEGAGLIAVTVFGMALTNLHIPGLAELRRTKESLVVLVVSVLFILLTADLQRGALAHLSIPIMALTLVVLFVVRPVGIFLATLGSDMTWRERVFVGWIAPRGIVAAAVAGAAGIRLHDSGYHSADLIMPAVFSVIAVTMLLHGFSLRPLARAMKLSFSSEPALALVGASSWSINLALTLKEQNIPVLLVDSRASALMPAARQKISVLRAELLSQHGQEALEERPADYLISTTADGIYNGMICGHLAPALGRERVFQISPGVSRLDLYHGLSRDARGKVLGEPAWNFTLFESLFDQGWRFTAQTSTEDTSSTFGKRENRLDLLFIRRKTGIFILSAEDLNPASPVAGDILISMVPPKAPEPSPVEQ